eukprot:10589779-Alexandrium_andersonii.AAC.1
MDPAPSEPAEDGWRYYVAFGELPGQFALAILRWDPTARVLIVSKKPSTDVGVVGAAISPRVRVVEADAFDVWRRGK